MYYILFQILIQEHFVLYSITCVNSMEVSYIPIAKARGFTTHWINLEKPSEPHYSLTVSTVQGKFCVKKSGRETLFFSAPQPGISFSFLIQSHPYKHCKSPGQCSL